jgi:hypothetical protein
MTTFRSRIERQEATMDIEALRKQYLAEIEASGPPTRSSPEAVADYAASEARDPEKMCEMIERLPLGEERYDNSVRTLLDILGNADVDTNSRLAALRHLAAAEFQPQKFAPYHAEYIDLLRRLAVEGDTELREAALDRLTLTNDPAAQILLQESLEKVRKPLVSAAKAVQLLARDEHARALPMFRKLVASASGAVREEALRALSGDSKSAALFESIAGNREEKSSIREIAALNLKNTSTARVAKLARTLVLDDKNDDKLRAAAVSAITHTRDVAAKLTSSRFANALEAAGAASKSRALKSSIQRFAKRQSGEG